MGISNFEGDLPAATISQTLHTSNKAANHCTESDGNCSSHTMKTIMNNRNIFKLNGQSL